MMTVSKEDDKMVFRIKSIEESIATQWDINMQFLHSFYILWSATREILELLWHFMDVPTLYWWAFMSLTMIFAIRIRKSFQLKSITSETRNICRINLQWVRTDQNPKFKSVSNGMITAWIIHDGKKFTWKVFHVETFHLHFLIDFIFYSWPNQIFSIK